MTGRIIPTLFANETHPRCEANNVSTQSSVGSKPTLARQTCLSETPNHRSSIGHSSRSNLDTSRPSINPASQLVGRPSAVGHVSFSYSYTEFVATSSSGHWAAAARHFGRVKARVHLLLESRGALKIRVTPRVPGKTLRTPLVRLSQTRRRAPNTPRSSCVFVIRAPPRRANQVGSPPHHLWSEHVA